jgi:glyoxylase-like metal-dependent hydrolase (beta-lactamase superfamily II)
MNAGTVDFGTGAPVAGDLDVRWIHGSLPGHRGRDPKIQVHRYDEHTVVLRQSKETSFEAPFLYLFCGNERALLLDTGATADPDRFPLRSTVDEILRGWLAAHPREGYELVVAHTHAHGDHVAGDSQFADRPATRLVGTDVAAVQAFFGFRGWPAEVVTFDLGGRELEITGCPGHHATSIAVYDPWSGFLVTGDTVYKGRLYVPDFPAFTASLDRLVAFAAARPVTHVLGCHIEMASTPGRDYPLFTTYQPREPLLQMTTGQLAAVRDAAAAAADRPGVHVHDDFIIYHGRCRRGIAVQLARGAVGRLRNRVAGLLRR